MKRTRFAQAGRSVAVAALAASLLSGCTMMKQPVQRPPAEEPATHVYQLDNGLTVVVREDHFAPVVALQMWVKAGAADERDEEAGVAHVHEHMLFKGTDRRAVGEIAATIESAGGQINAWTSWDQTVYHVVVASRHADTALDVLADAVRHSSFDPTELKRELAVVLEEWKRGQDSPGRRIFDALFATAFTRHPYGRPVIGTERSIQGLTREKVLAFFRRFYAPNNMVLVVVGDIDPDHLREQVERLLGDFEPHPIERPERPVEPEQQEMRFRTERMQVQEAHLALGFHIPSATHEDAPVLDVLAFVLGEGESSRLYRRLVAETQLARSVSAYAYTPPDPGLLVVSASLEAEDMAKAYDAIVGELARLRNEEVSEEELERARVNLEADFVFQAETVQGQARELGYAVVIHGDPDWDRRYLERIRATTADDLKRVAQKYLTRDNLSVVELLPSGARAVLDRARAEKIAVALAAPSAAAVARGNDQAAGKQAGEKAAERKPGGAVKPGAGPAEREAAGGGFAGTSAAAKAHERPGAAGPSKGRFGVGAPLPPAQRRALDRGRASSSAGVLHPGGHARRAAGRNPRDERNLELHRGHARARHAAARPRNLRPRRGVDRRCDRRILRPQLARA